ncbi:Nn.00g080320.m01.CDS01 [Neocucurbitaria sp. VM-36]
MVDFLIKSVPLHVTGLDDLQYLLLKAHRVPTTFSSNDDTLAIAFAQAHHLNIILRLPLRTFKKIERHYSNPNTESLSENATAWIRLCPAIAELSNLKTLRLWEDYDASKSWTTVNERTFLAPLQQLIVSMSGLNVSVSLPKLHPRWESSNRHFIPGCAPPAFAIDRRLRQWVHAIQTRDE